MLENISRNIQHQIIKFGENFRQNHRKEMILLSNTKTQDMTTQRRFRCAQRRLTTNLYYSVILYTLI